MFVTCGIRHCDKKTRKYWCLAVLDVVAQALHSLM